jgi:hypothetical protein
VHRLKLTAETRLGSRGRLHASAGRIAETPSGSGEHGDFSNELSLSAATARTGLITVGEAAGCATTRRTVHLSELKDPAVAVRGAG